MSVSAVLNETSIVCRTCLKVLDSKKFTYIDDESGYVNNVGNVREMLQFCIPELDLYVSTNPVICYQCLTILVQVYNFKIKCLNGENIIKAYITRNNLHEYNHVNLNCVLMDDLKIKTEKIHSNSRLKHMMLKELPENGDPNAGHISTEPQQIMSDINQVVDEPVDSSFSIISSQPENQEITEDIQNTDVNEMKIEFDEIEETEPEVAENLAEEESDVFIDQDDLTSTSQSMEEEGSEIQMTKVVVRKDLFENNNKNNSNTVVQEAVKEQPTLILNNGMINQNGRIVLKIDRSKLRALTVAPTENDLATVKVIKNSLDQSKTTKVTTPPPINPIQISIASSTDADGGYNTQYAIVEPMMDSPSGEKDTSYDCNKCDFVTTDVIEMYDHNRTKHSFDYTCQHCPFSTSKVELLGKHMTMVHPQNMVAKRNANFKVTENYACSLCPFSVKSIDLLRSHHLSAHGTSDGEKGPIVLNSAFSEDLVRHEPRILKRFEYTCDVCPYSTKDKSNLRKHLFTHGTKPLKCDHCTYKCVSPYQLRRHQKQKHAKQFNPRPRNQPYELPDFKKEKQEAMDKFKITLESIKRELEREISSE